MQLSTFSSKVFEILCISRVLSKIICVQIVYKDLTPILYDFHNLQVEYLKLWGYGEVDNTFYLSNNPIHYTYDDEYGRVPYKDNKKMLYNFYIE